MVNRRIRRHVSDHWNSSSFWAASRAGYLMEKGNLLVLMQPAELLIIGGAASGLF